MTLRFPSLPGSLMRCLLTLFVHILVHDPKIISCNFRNYPIPLFLARGNCYNCSLWLFGHAPVPYTSTKSVLMSMLNHRPGVHEAYSFDEAEFGMESCSEKFIQSSSQFYGQSHKTHILLSSHSLRHFPFLSLRFHGIWHQYQNIYFLTEELSSNHFISERFHR